MAETFLPAGLTAGYTELWPLFEKQAALYNYGSTSMRDETAQALMAGVRYTVNLGGTAGSQDISTRFGNGRKAIDSLLRKSRTLLAGVQKTAIVTENLSYLHTLHALPAFFSAYDRLFFPQNLPCDIDYQTALPMLESDSGGVVWYHEYLRRLLLENQFCTLFPAKARTALLLGAYPALQDDLVNLYTPLLLTALSASVLGQDVRALALGTAGRAQLLLAWRDMEYTALLSLLEAECVTLIHTHFPGNNALLQYVKQTVRHVAPALYSAVRAGDLSAVLPTPAGPAPPKPQAYEDGALLPARKLRALIAEARDCRFTSDKLSILQRDIHSLRDFTDFMDNCLRAEECPAAFALLTHAELQTLCKRLAAEHNAPPLPYWGEMLVLYMRKPQ